MQNIKYEISTEKSFDTAVADIIKSLENHKFGVLWKLNFKEKLNEKGIEFARNFMILEVCNPQKAKEVLSHHLDIGYFLPCKIVVYEDDNAVKIGTINPNMLINMLGYDDVQDAAEEVEAILKSAIDSAV